jgi:hypothetical protein
MIVRRGLGRMNRAHVPQFIAANRLDRAHIVLGTVVGHSGLILGRCLGRFGGRVA